MLRRPNAQGQITIPIEFLRRIDFDPRSDYFDVELHDNVILLKPATVEPKFTPEEMEEIEGLFTSPENKGEIFASKEAALKALGRMKKRRAD